MTEKTKEKKKNKTYFYGFRSTETYFTIEAGHIIVHIILYHSIIKVNNCIVNRIRMMSVCKSNHLTGMLSLIQDFSFVLNVVILGTCLREHGSRFQLLLALGTKELR